MGPSGSGALIASLGSRVPSLFRHGHEQLVQAVAPVQLVRVYYEPALVAGSKLEQPVVIPDGVHAELRRLGVRVTRFVEDFMGARLPTPEEERALQLPSGVPVTRNIRTAYAGDKPVEVMDTIPHGEVVSHRFEIML
jgi:DNA-binding GntR family transcriptional regulator